MRQILFTVRLHDWLGVDFLPNIPVYGYGMMLFFAFIFCNALARRLCRREGIDGNLMLDLAIWLFVSGIIGGRIVFVIQYWYMFAPIEPFTQKLLKIVSLWDGGLVFYGSIFGGAAGYFTYYNLYLRQHHVSNWKMLDVAAPCIALGLALGRVGCLFTGCCYGNVACADCPQIHFPVGSPPTQEMVKRGYQTPLGFLLKGSSLVVEGVEPGSAAQTVGLLQANDEIIAVNGKDAREADAWRVSGAIKLTVHRSDGSHELPEFTPRSIGLNPTQIYETISMGLLLFFLLSYYPYKRHDGELMVFLMLGYGVHRFINEMLRTDTDKVAFNLTLSQNISIAVLACAVVLAILVWRRAAITAPAPT